MRFGLLALCVAGFVLRVSVFFRHDGPLGWPIDYDEGVYTAATLFLTRGVLPYRDFFFAHPPGVMVALAPFIAWFSPAHALIAGRVVIACCGAVTTSLLGLTVERQTRSPMAALFAASLYACWPEAVVAERSVLLEPLLNVLGIGAAWFWLNDDPRAIKTGVLLGLMLTVKWWAGAWLVAALLTAPNRRAALTVLGVTTATFLIITAPFALFAPVAFVEQTLLFHLARPPDGDLSRLVRLREMFFSSSGLITLSAALLGFKQTRFALTIVAMLSAAFLGAAAFWNSYDAHLALPLCLAAGFALAKAPRWVIAILALVCVVPATARVLSMRHARDTQQHVRAQALENQVACSFESTDVLLADRMPANHFVDSYGAMLFEAVKGGQRYDHASLAFASDDAQHVAQIALFPCEIVMLGPRGEGQFAASARWQQSHLQPLGNGAFRKTK